MCAVVIILLTPIHFNRDSIYPTNATLVPSARLLIVYKIGCMKTLRFLKFISGFLCA